MPSATQPSACKLPWPAAPPRPAPAEFRASDGEPMAESVHLRSMFDVWSILDPRYAIRETCTPVAT